TPSASVRPVEPPPFVAPTGMNVTWAPASGWSSSVTLPDIGTRAGRLASWPQPHATSAVRQASPNAGCFIGNSLRQVAHGTPVRHRCQVIQDRMVGVFLEEVDRAVGIRGVGAARMQAAHVRPANELAHDGPVEAEARQPPDVDAVARVDPHLHPAAIAPGGTA